MTFRVYLMANRILSEGWSPDEALKGELKADLDLMKASAKKEAAETASPRGQ